MKSVVGVVVGGLLAFAIACGGSGSAYKSNGGVPPRTDAGGGLTNPRAELERLDQEITAEMQKLAEPRPAPPVGACAENCAQPMATQASQAKQATQNDAATCKPAQTETCTQSCTLKTSICTNASKICSIAADLGGNDAYANEVCNRGLASCEAAQKRCCSCM